MMIKILIHIMDTMIQQGKFLDSRFLFFRKNVHGIVFSFPDDVPLVPLEFLSDAPLTAADLCTDFSLGLHESEPDSWTPYVGKEIARKLKEKEVKRQEHIYEFILTEKHHCMTLLVMQKVY